MTLNEWNQALRAGLWWPTPTPKPVGVPTFSWHVEDYDATWVSGSPTGEPPEEPDDVAYDEELIAA